MQRACAIRRRVFIEEQHVPEEIEMDADDAHAFHALAHSRRRRHRMRPDGRAWRGRSENRPHGGAARIRKTGVGAHILRFLIDRARTRGFRKAILHAQLTAEGFYLKEGFSPVGGVFDEAGIAHRKMERAL